MGYYAQLASAQCFVQADQREEVAQVLRRWLDRDDDLDDVTILHNMLGFDLARYRDGSYDIIGYDFRRLANNDEVLRVLAPFVSPGSFFQWRGDDEHQWRDIVISVDDRTRAVVTVEPEWPNPLKNPATIVKYAPVLP